VFLLHTIGVNSSATGTDPWIARYIFPNSHLPTLAEIAAAAERHWVIEDWHNFGVDYDRTLMSWATTSPGAGMRCRAMTSGSAACGATGC
jgi:cyclopropane-fatty-acyl-phospholipid synthase